MNGIYTPEDVLRILNVTAPAFPRYLRAALFRWGQQSRPRRFSFHDLILLRTAKGLLEQGIPITNIRKVLASLKRQLPEGQSLAQINVHADGRRVVVWDRSGRWQPDSGQFLLNFEACDLSTSGRVTKFVQSKRPAWKTAEQWLNHAVELEEHSPDAARRAYQEALSLDDSLIEAHINLGLLYHRQGHVGKAETCYRAAIALDPAHPLGHYNLGELLDERGDCLGAIEAYEQAVTHDPTLKNAHDRLALLYHAAGNETMAFRHVSASYKLARLKRKRSKPGSRPDGR